MKHLTERKRVFTRSVGHTFLHKLGFIDVKCEGNGVNGPLKLWKPLFEPPNFNLKTT